MAAGGYDPNAPTEQKLLYRLKHLLPVHVWQRKLFRQTLREMFYETHADFSGVTFRRRLLRSLLNDYRSLAAKNWRQNPESVNLYEVYYGRMTCDEAFEAASSGLEINAERMIESDLFEQLCEVATLDRIEVPDFFNFSLEPILVWCTLDLGWHRREKVGFLAVTERDDGGKSLVTAALHKSYAQGKLGVPPDRVVTQIWETATGVSFIVPDQKINISRTIDYLHETAMPPCSAVRPETADDNEFPRHPENCARCRFLEYCETH